MSAVNPPTESVAAVWYALLGGKYLVRLDDESAPPGRRSGVVMNSSGEVIGYASDYIYGGAGFSVHTKPFGGYVPSDQIVFQHEIARSAL